MIEKKFIKTVRRPYPPFYVGLIWEGFIDEKIWQSFLGFKYYIKEAVLTDHIWFYTVDHLEKFPLKVTKILFKNPSFFQKIKRESLKRERKLLSSINKDFQEFCQAYLEYMPTLGLYFICDDIIENKVKDLLSQKLKEEEVFNLMSYLTTPFSDNFHKQELIDLVRAKDLERHVQKYIWINSRYGNIEPYTITQAKNKLKKINKNEFINNYFSEKRKIKEAVLKAKSYLDKKNRHIVDVMQFFIYYRTQRTDIMNRVAYLYNNELAKFAREKDLSYKELLYCLKSELENRLPTKNTIKQRMRGFSIVLKNKKIKIFWGKDHKNIVKKYLLTKEKVKILNGRIAYPGRFSGKVIIIKSRADYKKFKKGNVLVTSMTSTDMMPILHKAGAIVTNEGGITCHAAIVSRELKIPAIIGTKIATEVFNDGDLVEVDAEKGLVKKL